MIIDIATPHFPFHRYRERPHKHIVSYFRIRFRFRVIPPARQSPVAVHTLTVIASEAKQSIIRWIASLRSQ
jgi:hypothetical protein